MAVIYANQGRYTNPWEVMLPSFLSQMILQSHAGKIRKELTAQEQGFTEEMAQAKAAMTEGVSEEPTEFEPSQAPPQGTPFQIGKKKYLFNPKDRKPVPFELGGKQGVYTPETGAIHWVPSEPQESSDIQGYNLAVKQGYKGDFNTWMSEVKRTDKPTNMPPWYDSLAKEHLGSKSNDPKAMKEFDDYLKSPEGKRKAAAYRIKYAKETATPFYNVLPTDEGPVPFDARTGTAGGPTGVSPPLSEDHKKDRTALAQAYDLVQTLETMWDEVAPEGRWEGTVEAFEALLARNPKAKAYIDQSSSFLGQLSRSVAMERGVLTNQDIDRMKPAIARLTYDPRKTDTKEEAKIKWDTLYDIMAKAEDRLEERAKMRTEKPGRIVPKERIKTKGTKAPKIGTVDGGYVFQGGDPSNPKSWIPVK